MSALGEESSVWECGGQSLSRGAGVGEGHSCGTADPVTGRLQAFQGRARALGTAPGGSGDEPPAPGLHRGTGRAPQWPRTAKGPPAGRDPTSRAYVALPFLSLAGSPPPQFQVRAKIRGRVLAPCHMALTPDPAEVQGLVAAPRGRDTAWGPSGQQRARHAAAGRETPGSPKVCDRDCEGHGHHHMHQGLGGVSRHVGCGRGQKGAGTLPNGGSAGFGFLGDVWALGGAGRDLSAEWH